MRVKIQLFGRLAERLGREAILEVPEGCTLRDLRQALAKVSPASASDLVHPSVLASVDQEIMRDDSFVVQPGQELAFFPPLSGG